MSNTQIIYLSGPMSGIPEHNFPAFMEATARLRKQGYYVVNPAELNPPDTEYTACSRKDIRHLTECNGIALLPGWQKSRGARLELINALHFGLFVIDAMTLAPMTVDFELQFHELLESSEEDVCRAEIEAATIETNTGERIS